MQESSKSEGSGKISSETDLEKAIEVMMKYQSFAENKIKGLTRAIHQLDQNLEQPYVKNKE